MYAELAIATAISPRELIELDPEMVATMLEVLAERNN